MTPLGPYDVLDLDLGRPEPVPARDRDVFAVCWMDDVPLGHFVVDSELLPLTVADVWQRMRLAVAPALGAYLAEGSPSLGPRDAALTPELVETVRGRLAIPPSASGPSMSVVIPTRDRPEDLARCLDSLSQQTSPPCEIVVVDNAPSTDQTQRVVESRPDVRYVREARVGISAARNAGVRESAGDVVAFTDDDMVMHPRWLARLGLAFQDPETAAVTGLSLPAELETDAQVLFELEWGFGRGYGPKTFGSEFLEDAASHGAPVWEIGAGANMAVRRSALTSVGGGFDERLGAGASGCSEDSELWYRLLTAGHVVRYVPSAVGHHRHRRTLPELHKQLRAYMRGHVSGLLVQHESARDRGNIRRLTVQLPRYYAGLVARGLRSGFRGRYATLGSEIWGAVSGVAYYARHRGQPRGYS